MKPLPVFTLCFFMAYFCGEKLDQKDGDGSIYLFNGKDLTLRQTTGNSIPRKDGSLFIQPRAGKQGWQGYSDYLISKKIRGLYPHL